MVQFRQHEGADDPSKRVIAPFIVSRNLIRQMKEEEMTR
jgi:hypothetical protein